MVVEPPRLVAPPVAPLGAPPAAPPNLRLTGLVAENLRCLRRLELRPDPGLNVLYGANGQGKTSVLEAIYLLCTSRSFRTARLSELGAHGTRTSFVRGRFSELPAPTTREQTASLEGATVQVRVDGNRPSSLSAYAILSPVVVFHPDELALSRGPARGRRTLLDRIALFMDPATVEHRARYAKALRSRQELLRRGGADDGALEAFEVLVARHGAALTRARAASVDVLRGALAPAFARIAAPGLVLDARYEPGGSEDEVLGQQELRRQRGADARRKSAGFGPHRDDLALFLDGFPARFVASQGQHRALALALKAAEAACVTEARGLSPLWLLDDVSSELDPARTEALFAFLAGLEGQVFLTTTRPDVLETGAFGARTGARFVVDAGSVTEAPPGGR